MRVAAPTNWSESRRRAPLVRRAGRFRGLSKGEASGAVGSGRDEVGCGGAFWVKIVAIAPPRAYPQPLDSQPRPERVPIWERSVKSSAVIKDGKITEYHVNVKVAFVMEGAEIET